MQTRCHTSGSFHLEFPQPLALWTFPLAGIHPHCLDKLTIGRPRMCVCAHGCMWFSAFHPVCVFIFKNEWIHTSNNCTTFVRVHECKHAEMCLLLRLCVCVHVCQCSCPITVFLSVGLCALRSPLLAAVHKENCWRLLGFPQSPPGYKTLTHSVLQFTRYTTWISFLRVRICTYPIYLKARNHRTQYTMCMCESAWHKQSEKRVRPSVIFRVRVHMWARVSLVQYYITKYLAAGIFWWEIYVCLCVQHSEQYSCISHICHMLLNILLRPHTTLICYSCVCCSVHIFLFRALFKGYQSEMMMYVRRKERNV